jgi:hypothetical protein
MVAPAFDALLPNIGSMSPIVHWPFTRRPAPAGCDSCSYLPDLIPVSDTLVALSFVDSLLGPGESRQITVEYKSQCQPVLQSLSSVDDPAPGFCYKIKVRTDPPFCTNSACYTAGLTTFHGCACTILDLLTPEFPLPCGPILGCLVAGSEGVINTGCAVSGANAPGGGGISTVSALWDCAEAALGEANVDVLFGLIPGYKWFKAVTDLAACANGFRELAEPCRDLVDAQWREQTVCVGAPADPNEIVGPAGVGSQHYLQAGADVGYRVTFENMPTATVPAHVVAIQSAFDTSMVDAASMTLNEVGIGEPAYRNTKRDRYSQDVPGQPGVEAEVFIRLTVCGTIGWWMVTIDASTGLPRGPDRLLAAEQRWFGRGGGITSG